MPHPVFLKKCTEENRRRTTFLRSRWAAPESFLRSRKPTSSSRLSRSWCLNCRGLLPFQQKKQWVAVWGGVWGGVLGVLGDCSPGAVLGCFGVSLKSLLGLQAQYLPCLWWTSFSSVLCTQRGLRKYLDAINLSLWTNNSSWCHRPVTRSDGPTARWS